MLNDRFDIFFEEHFSLIWNSTAVFESSSFGVDDVGWYFLFAFVYKCPFETSHHI